MFLILKFAFQIFFLRGGVTIVRPPYFSAAMATQVIQLLCVSQISSLQTSTVHPLSFKSVKQVRVSSLIPSHPLYSQLSRDPENSQILSVHEIILACWNVRGCSTREKQIYIDTVCYQQGIQVLCLQECKFSCEMLRSPNYHWYINRLNTVPTSRGTAILISKDLASKVVSFACISQDLCYLRLKFNGGEYVVICYHAPTSGSLMASRSYMELAELLNTITLSQLEYCLLGDFNARIGAADRDESCSINIGQHLGHYESNHNGQLLKDLSLCFNLEILTTNQQCTRYTFSSGTVLSQLDHVLIPIQGTLLLKRISNFWFTREHFSDHSLIVAHFLTSTTDTNSVPVFYNRKTRFLRSKDWDLKLLNQEYYREQYFQTTKRQYDLINWDNLFAEGISTNIWLTFCSILKRSAAAALKPLASDDTPAVRLAKSNLRQALYNNNIQPSIGNCALVQVARQTLRQQEKEQELQNFTHMISALGDLPEQERMACTFKYLKRKKRDQQTSLYSAISITQWEQELTLSEGPPVALLPNESSIQNDNLNSPTLADVQYYIKTSKRGKCPGLDLIVPEMLQFATPEVTELFHRILQHIFEHNDPPSQWQQTYSVPIPKIPRPTNISHYRILTMCCWGYNVYTKFLVQQQLSQYIDIRPYYQAGFERGRSTLDQLFILLRVLEENWRKGRRLYILSLDLRRAFPSVNIHKMPELLLSKGVPVSLINRYVKNCLHERNFISWCGQRTREINKSIGMKQGCSGSPFSFNEILHSAVTKLKDYLLEHHNLALDIGQLEKEGIDLPLCLAYADDIIFVSTSLTELNQICNAFMGFLGEVGLSINNSKSCLILRDPSFDAEAPESVLLGEMEIPVRTDTIYLGANLSGNLRYLQRKPFTKSRGLKVLKIYHWLLPTLREAKMPWAMLHQLYDILLVPVMLYGMKVSCLTKQNRRTLMHKEVSIIRGLSQISNPPCSNVSVIDLLEGRTINKVLTNHRLRYAFHIQRRPQNTLIRKAYTYSVPGSFKHGRPAFNFHTSLRRDFQQYAIRRAEWNDNLHDPEKLRLIANSIYTDGVDEFEDEIWRFEQYLQRRNFSESD
jgi:hypothetical protein